MTLHLIAKRSSQKIRLKGHRITVDFLACFVNDPEWSVERICAEYELYPEQVYAAWSYYYAHKAEIDQMIEDGEKLAEKVAQPLDDLKND